MSEPILEIDHLSVRFENAKGAAVQAVKNASLRVGRASFISLVGRSGSGKSVTALSVTRLVNARWTGQILYHASRGMVDLLKIPIAQLRAFRGSEISTIFQDASAALNPVLTVGEQLVETYLANRRDNKRAASAASEKLLASLEIQDPKRVMRAFPHELSGGLRQRAAVAVALISEPKLLIADEPTTALDVLTQKEILDLLKGLVAQRGLSVLFITHDLSLAAKRSDVIYVMEKGETVERLEPRSGQVAPSHPYSRKLFLAASAPAKPKTLIEV